MLHRKLAILSILQLILSITAAAQNSKDFGNSVSSRQRTPGEFALIISKPLACVNLFEYVRPMLQPRELVPGQKSGDYNAFRGGRPECRLTAQCGEALTAQSVALIAYLKNNPAVAAALRSYLSENWKMNDYDLWVSQLERRIAADKSRFGPDARPSPTCRDDLFIIQRQYLQASSELPVAGTLPPTRPQSPGVRLPNFEALSLLAWTVRNKVRAEYETDTEIYRELVAFNDRYAGAEALERTYTAYNQAYENDDIAGLVSQRPEILKVLELAKQRKSFLIEHLMHSSRLVIADVFPDDQFEITTGFPVQFGGYANCWRADRAK